MKRSLRSQGAIQKPGQLTFLSGTMGVCFVVSKEWNLFSRKGPGTQLQRPKQI